MSGLNNLYHQNLSHVFISLPFVYALNNTVTSDTSVKYLVILNNIQRRICNVTGLDLASRFQLFLDRHNVALLCLSYEKFYGNYSDDRSSLGRLY